MVDTVRALIEESGPIAFQNASGLSIGDFLILLTFYLDSTFVSFKDSAVLYLIKFTLPSDAHTPKRIDNSVSKDTFPERTIITRNVTDIWPHTGENRRRDHSILSAPMLGEDNANQHAGRASQTGTNFVREGSKPNFTVQSHHPSLYRNKTSNSASM
ncbi:hypothetical protein HPB48_016986 [Haemaphysalis longicornis]|uniref:Uncharacterized protein n=1 Tax=Haemaphysalis longicornis TaxID=44386 RepID=A0A9J6G8Y8_HAELO|nr:hypothetical protein HPB48_016986 [Haemaphysalis longicornis]